MEELMAYGPTFIVCIPVFMTIIFYQIHSRIRKNKWKAIHFSVQYSVFFYIMAVFILLDWIFSKYFLGFILIFLIALLSVILVVQWKSTTEVLLMEGLIVLSRISFLVFSITYAGLLLYVVISGYLA